MDEILLNGHDITFVIFILFRWSPALIPTKRSKTDLFTYRLTYITMIDFQFIFM